MKSKSIFPLLFLMLLLSGSIDCKSQGGLSLDQCLEFAMANNLSIRSFQIQKEKQDIYLQSAKNQFFPVINFNGRNQYNWGLFIDPATNILTNNSSQIYAAALSGELTLFDGGQTYYTIKQQKELNNASESDLQKARQDITINTIIFYYQVLYATEQLEISNLQRERTIAQLNRLKGEVDAGVLHRRELINMESELALREVDIVNASNLLERNKLLLRQVLGIMDEQDILIQKVDTSAISESLQTSYSDLVKDISDKLPQIGAYNSRLKASEYALRSAYSERYPTVGLSSGIITRSSSLLNIEQKKQFRQNLSEYVGFSLIVPIFSKFEIRNKIALTRVELKLLENQRNQTKLEAEKEIQNAFLDMTSAQKKFIALGKQEKALMQDYIFAERSYQAGTFTFIDFKIIMNNYNNLQHQIVQSRYDFLLKKRLLNYYENIKKS